MTRINTRIFLPGLSALVGALWIFVGLTEYGWWANGRATSGFFPTLVGALLIIVSVLAITSEVKEKAPVFMTAHIYPLLAAVSVVVVALLIGFFPALTLYVLGWLKLYEKFTWKFSLLVTLVTIAAMYGIFAMWLRVPFPLGAIVEMVIN